MAPRPTRARTVPTIADLSTLELAELAAAEGAWISQLGSRTVWKLTLLGIPPEAFPDTASAEAEADDASVLVTVMTVDARDMVVGTTAATLEEAEDVVSLDPEEVTLYSCDWAWTCQLADEESTKGLRGWHCCHSWC
jgi:hypothetical protein